MRYQPSPAVQERLIAEGLERFAGGVDLDDAEFARIKGELCGHHIHQGEAGGAIEDRVGYFMLCRDYGVQEAAGRDASSNDVVTAKRIVVIHETLREVAREHLPALVGGMNAQAEATKRLAGVQLAMSAAAVKDAANLAGAIEGAGDAIGMAIGVSTQALLDRGKTAVYWILLGFGLLFAATLVAPLLHGQNVDIQRVRGATTFYDGANTAFRVLCVGGTCGSAAPFADNAAFTFGTTSLSPTGFVFDDAAPNACTENSACVARINANRILYVLNTNSTGTEVGTLANPFRVDPTGTTPQPVSGTFWQATQPVSGTFWQATQPISAASLPLPTGASTAAKQPALGTAGAASADVITVQGIAAMTPLLVNGSGFTQPVSGTVTVTDGAGSLNTIVDSGILTTVSTVTNLSQLGGAAISMNTGVRDAGTQRVTIATNDLVPVTDGAGALNTIVDSGTITTVTTVTTANLAAETTKVIGTVRAQGNLGAAFDAATGAAPPANAVLAGGLTSGATGGFVTAIPVSDSIAVVNISTATTTLVVTGVSGRHVRISGFSLLTAAANNVAFISGTGATCGTGTAGMSGGTTAASGYNFAANGGIAHGSGIGTVLKTVATGDSVCLVTSAATQLSGQVSYTIY